MIRSSRWPQWYLPWFLQWQSPSGSLPCQRLALGSPWYLHTWGGGWWKLWWSTTSVGESWYMILICEWQWTWRHIDCRQRIWNDDQRQLKWWWALASHQLQAKDLGWSTSIELAMDTGITSNVVDEYLMIHVSFVTRACYMARVYIQPYPDMQVRAGKFRDIRTNRTSVLGRVYSRMYLPWAGENFVDI